MPIPLGTAFTKDIQSRDTNLVPVVIIGSSAPADAEDFIILYTGDWQRSGIWGSTALPLLLNIPSLKESIDIEKRNYKVSSVNLTISNMPYNGKQFSDIVKAHPVISESLINVECRIYWATPTAMGITFWDVPNPSINLDDAMFQVYYGVIRRYEHNNDTVTIVLEDKSQDYFHGDVPMENLGAGNDVPDKYKNKPYPMVYGKVDKSPCIVRYLNSAWCVFLDKESSTGIGGLIPESFIYDESLPDNFLPQLSVYVDGHYLRLLKYIDVIFPYLLSDPYYILGDSPFSNPDPPAEQTQWTEVSIYQRIVPNFWNEHNILVGLGVVNPTRIELKYGMGGTYEGADVLTDLTDYDPSTTFSGEMSFCLEIPGVPNQNYIQFRINPTQMKFYFELPQSLAGGIAKILINALGITFPSHQVNYLTDDEGNMTTEGYLTAPTIIIFDTANLGHNNMFKNDFRDYYGDDTVFYNKDDVEGIDFSNIFNFSATDDELENGEHAFRFSHSWSSVWTNNELIIWDHPYLEIQLRDSYVTFSFNQYLNYTMPSSEDQFTQEHNIYAN